MKRWLHSLEEVILAGLILLNVLDFFQLLSADVDYFKKILSWVTLGYLLYKVSLTKIFFNERHSHVDILLIVSFFMLIFKNLVVFSSTILDQFVIFYDFQKFIVDKLKEIQGILTKLLGSKVDNVVDAQFEEKPVPEPQPGKPPEVTREEAMTPVEKPVEKPVQKPVEKPVEKPKPKPKKAEPKKKETKETGVNLDDIARILGAK